jgi:glycolate oxidase FAD binding subunit
MSGYAGIVEVDEANRIVTAKAGTPLQEVQDCLKAIGCCLPIGPSTPNQSTTIGGQVSLNLPHTLQAQHGTWSDWVLGMTVMLADGTVVKTGSKVIKNVAGYDLQRLLVGSRGSLAIILDITLRIWPLNALQEESLIRGDHDPKGCHVKRVQISDFEQADSTTERLVLADRAAGTIWHHGQEATVDDTTRRFMIRAKEQFDPTRKLNPGVWGFM